MKITEEKLTYLLFLFQQQKSGETISTMASKLGITKSTLSRVLSVFYQEGWMESKGKGELSTQGKQIAKNWKQEVECIERWLCGLGCQKSEQSYQEAITLATNLSNEVRRNIMNASRIEQFFLNIVDIKQVYGDVLGVYLQDGTYPFAFTIYKQGSDAFALSMANDAFEHPAQLCMEQGKGYLNLVSKEVEHMLFDGKVMVKDCPNKISYTIDAKQYNVLAHQHTFKIPIDTILFFHSKQERMLQASIAICIKTDHNCHPIPEKKAILQILFK